MFIYCCGSILHKVLLLFPQQFLILLYLTGIALNFHNISSAIPDDAPVLEESDNEDEHMPIESDKRITSKAP